MDYADYAIEDHGSIVLVRPMGPHAAAHLRAVTDGMWFGGALCVEPRDLPDLRAGLERDGFEVAA